jgi:rhamnulokinase
VQARAAGVLSGGLDAMRALIVRTQPLERYEPRGDDAAWRLAAKQLVDLRSDARLSGFGRP